MVPGVIQPGLFDMEATNIICMQPEEYCARVLAKICQTGLQNYNRRTAMLIEYRQLPQIVWSSVMDFFGVKYTNVDLHRMRTFAQFNSKNPQVYFENDTASKRHAANDLIRGMSIRWVVPLYEELQAIRLTQSNGCFGQ